MRGSYTELSWLSTGRRRPTKYSVEWNEDRRKGKEKKILFSVRGYESIWGLERSHNLNLWPAGLHYSSYFFCVVSFFFPVIFTEQRVKLHDTVSLKKIKQKIYILVIGKRKHWCSSPRAHEKKEKQHLEFFNFFFFAHFTLQGRITRMSFLKFFFSYIFDFNLGKFLEFSLVYLWLSKSQNFLINVFFSQIYHLTLRECLSFFSLINPWFNLRSFFSVQEFFSENIFLQQIRDRKIDFVFFFI